MAVPGSAQSASNRSGPIRKAPTMRERDLFLAAVEISDRAARRVYLDQACGDDAALRANVEALLASHGADPSFLKEPALEQLAAAHDPLATMASGFTDGSAAVSAAGRLSRYLAPSRAAGSLGR